MEAEGGLSSESRRGLGEPVQAGHESPRGGALGPKGEGRALSSAVCFHCR